MSKIFICPLPKSCTSQVLRDHFSQYDKDLKVRRSKNKGKKSKMFAIMELSSKPLFDLVMSLDHVVLDKKLKLKPFMSQDQRKPSGGKGDTSFNKESKKKKKKEEKGAEKEKGQSGKKKSKAARGFSKQAGEQSAGQGEPCRAGEGVREGSKQPKIDPVFLCDSEVGQPSGASQGAENLILRDEGSREGSIGSSDDLLTELIKKETGLELGSAEELKSQLRLLASLKQIGVELREDSAAFLMPQTPAMEPKRDPKETPTDLAINGQNVHGGPEGSYELFHKLNINSYNFSNQLLNRMMFFNGQRGQAVVGAQPEAGSPLGSLTGSGQVVRRDLPHASGNKGDKNSNGRSKTNKSECLFSDSTGDKTALELVLEVSRSQRVASDKGSLLLHHHYRLNY